jgi:type IV secretory pathway VirJ component
VQEAGRLGTIRVYRPSGTPVALVFLFSDRNGWSSALDDTAAALAARGTAVVGVDLPQYLRGLAASDDGCHYVISELEDLSHRLQREFAFPAYQWPVLAGVGAGGTLAYAALAQSPAATIAGAIGPDSAPPLATRVPLCPGAPSEPVSSGGFVYAKGGKLHGWWDALPAGDAPGSDLGAAIGRHIDGEQAPGVPDQLKDLPITEVRAAHAGDTMAVIYSGDGGWRDIDKQMAHVLAVQGVPVVGVDSLRYFWHRKEPDTLARDLERIVRYYGAAWGTGRVLLVGYSFGADVLPFIVSRLSPEICNRVEQVSLLGLSPDAAFEFHVTDWLPGLPAGETKPVLPELLRLDLRRVQCVYGADETDTLCRAPELAGAEIIGTTGGHHFDGDYRALAARVMDGAQRRRDQIPATGACRPS